MNGDIDLTCSLNRKYIPPDKGQKLFLTIDVTPLKPAAASLPATVCLLIDRSGSMAGNKLKNAKKGAINLINQMDSNDYCGVVTFEQDVDTVVPGMYVTDTITFEDKIKKIKTGGLTELYKGLQTAFDVLKGQIQKEVNTKRESVKRIILLSDGQPTDSRTVSEYRSLARFMRKMGVTITALGIGDDYNEDLLSAIAHDSGGMWYHITSPDRISGIFSEELTSMKTVVFSTPELVINVSQGVEVADVHKSNPDVHRISTVQEANVYRVPLMDMRAGEPQTIVVRIAVPPRPEGECRIAQVGITSGTVTKTVDVTVQYTTDESLWDETDPYSRTLFAVTETQIKVQDGLSGDRTALKQAETQLKTLLKDPGATQIKDIAERTVVLEKALEKSANMSEEEKKKVKSDLTRVKVMS